jgi:hypothetical protein
VSVGGGGIPRGKWSVPKPEGHFDAIQIIGTTIAPILAGFTITILVLVVVPPGKSQADPLRWRDPVLALLVFSALLLIISTQMAIKARSTLVKPDELRLWYPSCIDADGWPNQELGTYQKSLMKRTAATSAVCRHTYNAGTLLLFTAVAVLLVPSSRIDSTRQAALVAAAIAVAVEATWLTWASLTQNQFKERLPTLLTPACYAIGAAVVVHIDATGASRAAAATGITIAGTAVAPVAIRLILKGAGCWCRIVGAVMLAATLGAAFATVALLTNQGHAALAADSTAAVLVPLLLIIVITPSPRVLAKTPNQRDSERGGPRLTCL